MTDRLPDDATGAPLTPAGLTAFVLDLNGAEETYPFGPEARVFKVAGKVFGIDNTPVHRGLAEPTVSITVKALPENVPRLIRSVPGIDPGYHMSKKHWVTVRLDGTVPAGHVRELIAESHAIVVASLPKRLRLTLAG
ncbi:MmcQ/YjbR family DNA-binding protein [Cryobacterium sp.]|jgi:predicted DNA-binding protein (MmcQ/YjbR family)|uniref:MmcQ/YjbR family DNA-binding protein n=1 Tax=Cryobacterium sp. TaxID=1926290 RepID=UPI00262A5F17|nr:MmcQ/YjbR family DNA-binding protein [Cryobacterium sp.]MCU1445078.1 MmcQ/YjbR family DNA-binding protein [Cryobacterium sp.]